MAELKLPTPKLIEVPFAPRMRVKKKGDKKQVPPLEKRVLVGAPLILQLNKKTVGKDPDLMGFLEREKDKFNYYLVLLSVSLEPQKNEAFKMVTLNVSLDCGSTNGSPQSVAWSMQPMHDMDVETYTDSAKISSNAKLLSAEIGTGVEIAVKNEFVTPFGLQTPTPYWVFTPTSSRRISGAYQCKLIVRAPAAVHTQGQVIVDVYHERTGLIFIYETEYTKETAFTLG